MSPRTVLGETQCLKSLTEGLSNRSITGTHIEFFVSFLKTVRVLSIASAHPGAPGSTLCAPDPFSVRRPHKWGPDRGRKQTDEAKPPFPSLVNLLTGRPSRNDPG